MNMLTIQVDILKYQHKEGTREKIIMHKLKS